MPVFNNILAGAAGSAGGADAGYKIERSLRFHSADTAHLDKTPSAGNRKTWTWSGWVKLSKINSTNTLFAAGSGIWSGGQQTTLSIYNDNTLWLFDYNGGYVYQKKSNAVFRDPSAWQHVVVAVDTTDSTAADRVKLYVNGERISDFASSSDPSPDYQTFVNNNVAHYVSLNSSAGIDGYLADVHFIDGQALAPTDFGQTSSDNNWNPKEYTGTYGTNGFYLKFADYSSDDALGTDSSGNNNTWTVNNLSSGAQIANKGFDCFTYTGTGSNQSFSNLAFQPDFLWFKSTSRQDSHGLYDVVRGRASNLYSDLDHNENTSATSADLVSFDSNGFTLGQVQQTALNRQNEGYVVWAWKAGGTASSNDSGSIDTSVSVNTTYGFSVITYQGDGSTSSPSIGHGLGATPAFVIIKNRDGNQTYKQWTVKHKDLTSNKNIRLQLDAGEELATGSGAWYQGGIGDLTSNSVISFVTGSQNSTGNVNTNNTNYVCYAWSEVPGFSKFGSWTGTGTSSGPTITLGFKPRWVLFKRTDQSGDNWTIFDTVRDSGTLNIGLQPNSDLDEQTFGNRQIVVSDTGFQVTSTGSSSNATGGEYIYAAFADGAADEIDSLLDSPTNYEADTGNNGGNYCTWNPLATFTGVSGISAAREYSQGNLQVKIASGSTWSPGCGTISVNSGKWYAEFEVADKSGANHFHVGINPPLNHFTGVTYHSASDSGHWYGSNGQMWNAGTAGSAGAVATADNGDVIGVALDFDASTVTFYKNGTSLTSVSLNSNITTYGAVFGFDLYPTCSCIANFGQRPFKYSVPTGHLSLCSQNLTAPFDNPKTAFEVKKYTGNGSTQTVSLSHSPDWVWVKGINQGNDHEIASTVGLAANRGLASNLSARDFVTVIEPGTNGFYLDGNSDYANTNNINYISWNWDAGTTTSTNTNGTISAQVRANTQAGCSLIAYTGNQTSGATVGHGLSKAPSFWMMKAKESSGMWVVRHVSVPNTHYMQLDDPAQARNAVSDVTGDADSTATVIPIGAADANNNGATYIAFCLAEIPGFSSIGMYEGSGVERYVHCGFKPAFVLYKNFDASAGWQIYDSARSPFNVCDERLQANSASNEDTTIGIDILSNGFITKSTHTRTNTSGNTYLYVAMAENPFKTARAR